MSRYDPDDDWILHGAYGRLTGQGRGWSGLAVGVFGTNVHSTDEPDLAAAAFGGLLAAWTAGQVYKLILPSLLVWLVVSMVRAA